MSSAEIAIEHSIKEIDNLKKNLSRKKTRQIQSAEEKALLKATSQSWFNNHRKVISFIGNILLNPIDQNYHFILESANKNASRSLIVSKLTESKKKILSLQKNLIEITLAENTIKTENALPDFTPIVSNPQMREILRNRWRECSICIDNNAHLAATVMIGGLIESLLIMRINQVQDKSTIYKAKSVPKDKTNNKPKPISEWKLTELIDLAYELKWISKSTKDISNILREYRNYIHPHKEFADNISLNKDDATMFWEIAKNITRQLTGTI